MKYFQFTLAGPDAPGIVASVSGTLAKNRINIAHLRMCTMGTYFGGVLVFETEDEDEWSAESLHSLIFEVLDRRTVELLGKEVPQGAAMPITEDRHRYRLHIDTKGMDRAGIVAEFANVLFRSNCNVLDTQSTRVYSEEKIQCEVFFEFVLGEDSDPDILGDELDQLGDHLKCNIDFRPA